MMYKEHDALCMREKFSLVGSVQEGKEEDDSTKLSHSYHLYDREAIAALETDALDATVTT